MGKFVQTDLEEVFIEKNTVSSAYGQLECRVSSGPSARIARGHLINQQEDKSYVPWMDPTCFSHRLGLKI